jgi:hypothetical protein
MTVRLTRRTYPQPDSPASNLGPRERALAVFKYLLDLEPEQAVLHPLFPCIKHAFEQTGRLAVGIIPLAPSLVPLISGPIDGRSIQPEQGTL